MVATFWQSDLRLLARSDKMMVEHFTDGDLFDNTVPGWAPMTASGLYQWDRLSTGNSWVPTHPRMIATS
jgi:hypothetical protein